MFSKKKQNEMAEKYQQALEQLQQFQEARGDLSSGMSVLREAFCDAERELGEIRNIFLSQREEVGRIEGSGEACSEKFRRDFAGLPLVAEAQEGAEKTLRERRQDVGSLAEQNIIMLQEAEKIAQACGVLGEKKLKIVDISDRVRDVLNQAGFLTLNIAVGASKSEEQSEGGKGIVDMVSDIKSLTVQGNVILNEINHVLMALGKQIEILEAGANTLKKTLQEEKECITAVDKGMMEAQEKLEKSSDSVGILQEAYQDSCEQIERLVLDVRELRDRGKEADVAVRGFAEALASQRSAMGRLDLAIDGMEEK